MISLLRGWILAVGFCGLAACTPVAPVASSPNANDFSNTATLFPYTDGDAERLRQAISRPVKTTVALELGPKLVELRASYAERRPPDGASGVPLPEEAATQPMRYFDLLASSSRFDGKLVGESEIAYSGVPAAGIDQFPAMSRLTLRGNWGAANYGASYRNFGSGFVSTAGLKYDNRRHEREAWGEYDFKLFRLKTTLGELSERRPDTGLVSLTKAATTSLHLNRGGWSTLLSSSYSIVDPDEAGPDYVKAFTHGLSVAYRPTSFLTIEPAFNLREEWSHVTGMKTETPSGGVALVSTPLRDLSLTGRTSYARGFSEDPLKEMSTWNNTASLNWRLGRSLLGDQALSLQFNYNRQLSASPLATAPTGFNGLIQWKLVGF
jgi:hypothetical protein